MREWVEWVKYNLHIPTALSFRLRFPAKLKTRKFSFPFEKKAREIFEKMKENFWEFETSLWLVRKRSGN